MSSPRISVNKLGEYLQANSARRKRIVTDCKHPKKFITTRYTDAKNAVCQYFMSDYNTDIIDDSIAALEDKECKSDFQVQDRDLSIELLELVLDGDYPDLSHCDISLYNGDNPKVNISGVDISINPNLIIRCEKKGQKLIGGLKIHTSKSNSLDEEAGRNISTLIHSFISEHVASDDEKVDLGLCLSVDLPQGSYISAPKSFKRRLNHIAAACEEIVLWWGKV